jgi:hypothetical protein
LKGLTGATNEVNTNGYGSLFNSNESFTLKLSLEEIITIVGFDIDHSFLTHKKEIGQLGYKVSKISLKEKYIVFNKIDK